MKRPYYGWVVCLVSTLLTFAVTAWAVRLTRYLMDRRKK